jgi:hypothetical protein
MLAVLSLIFLIISVDSCIRISLKSVRVRAFGGYRFNVIFYVLLLSPCSAVAWPEVARCGHIPLPAAQKTGLVNSDSNSSDVLLPLDIKEESIQLRNRRMISLNEKEAATRDPQYPVPAPDVVYTKVSTAQLNTEHKWQTLFPFFSAAAEKRGYKLPYAIGVTPGFYY